MSQLLRDENGQAVVEYVLMVAFAIMIVSTIAVGFRKLLFKIWKEITVSVANPSPLQPAQGKFPFPTR